MTMVAARCLALGQPEPEIVGPTPVTEVSDNDEDAAAQHECGNSDMQDGNGIGKQHVQQIALRQTQ